MTGNAEYKQQISQIDCEVSRIEQIAALVACYDTNTRNMLERHHVGISLTSTIISNNR